MAKVKTFEQFVEDLRNVWGDRYTVSPNAVYVNTHTKIKILCDKHGEFEVTPNSILHGHGCKECRSETIGKNRVLPQEEVIKRIKDVWADKYDLSAIKYINARTKITPICKIHGPFEIRFSDFINLHGCPFCNESRLENRMANFLKERNIVFKRQYTEEWLKNGVGMLRLDFYLPEYNVAIEGQGKQHYSDKSKYSVNGEFQKIQERDLRKFNLCQENGVRVFYYTESKLIHYVPDIYKDVTYDNKDKLISEILSI